MKHRQDSVMASPRPIPTPPCSPHTPGSPLCDRKRSSPLLSPFSTPLKTIPKKVRTPKPRNIPTGLPPGLRPGNSPDVYADLPPGACPRLPLAEGNQRKRAYLHIVAVCTMSEEDKFRRTVEWDGTWLSTLALPDFEYYSDVQYFEDTFRETYPCVGQFARRHKFWKDGPELECGLRVDSFEAVDPAPLLGSEALFDFASYCEKAGELEEQTYPEQAARKAQSLRLREMVGRASIETCSREKNGTQARWLNQG